MEDIKRDADFQKLREMIKDIDFCMLTTLDENSYLHSRPMSLNGEVDEAGISGFSLMAAHTRLVNWRRLRSAMPALPNLTTIAMYQSRVRLNWLRTKPESSSIGSQN